MNQDSRRFYVYALFREDGATPFYIGKGRGNRWLIHERDARKGTSHKDRIIQSMLAAGIVTVPKAKIVENLTDAEAKQIEMDLIYLIGRWPLGPLANLTQGGDGVIGRPAESLAKTSEANRRSWKDPTVRQRRSDGMKAVWTAEKRAAHAALKVATAETRAKMRASRKALWADPEYRARHIAALNTPETKARKIAAAKATWVDAEQRARRSVASKMAQSRPEYREKRRKIALAIWAKRKAATQYAASDEPSANEHESQP